MRDLPLLITSFDCGKLISVPLENFDYINLLIMQIEKVDHLSQLKLVFSNRTRQTQNKQTKKVDHDTRAHPKAFQTMFVIFLIQIVGE